MIRTDDPALGWIIAAVAGALASTAMTLAVLGTGADGIAMAVRVTARWSFLFFWPSYVGGALAVVFGPVFDGWAQRSRSLGLAFAAALAGHIVLVTWLGVVIGRIPLQGSVLWFFVMALLFTVLLTLLSFRIGTRTLGRLWRPLLLLGTTYILTAFGRDFVLGALDPRARHWPDAAAYLPFALLSVAAIPLRLMAFLRKTDREPAV